jgi:hypothetical protein
MKILRALLIFVSIIIVGAGIGAALFYAQSHISKTTADSDSGISPTPTPTILGSVQSGTTYTNSTLGVSFTLPTDWLVMENTPTTDATVLTMVKKQSDRAAVIPTGLSLYVISSTSASSATKTAQRVSSQIMSTWKTLTFSPKTYQDADGNPVELTTHTAGDLVILAVGTPLSSDNDASTLVASLKALQASNTQSASPLLQSPSLVPSN